MNIDEIRVTPARDDPQRTRALELRVRGYSKFFSTPETAVDELDGSPHCLLLLATAPGGEEVGTMRILDGTHGPIELEAFVPFERLEAKNDVGRSYAEATRLAVSPGPWAKAAKLSLWKAFFTYSMKRRCRGMFVWGRPAAARQYRRLLFEDLGPEYEFVHPHLGPARNRSLWMDLREARERLCTANHPLYDFFFEAHHSNVRVD